MSPYTAALANASCEVCPLGCATCYNSTACSNCHVGYYLLSTSCLSCSLNCVSCSSASLCLQCVEGYTLTTPANVATGGSTCTSCKLSLGGSTCLACSYNTTDTLLHCLDCGLGYYLDNSTGVCVPCSVVGCTSCFNSSHC